MLTIFDALKAGEYACTARFGRAHGQQDHVDWSPWQATLLRVTVLHPVRGRRPHEARAIGVVSRDFAEFETPGDGVAENRLMAEDYILEVQPGTLHPVTA